MLGPHGALFILAVLQCARVGDFFFTSRRQVVGGPTASRSLTATTPPTPAPTSITNSSIAWSCGDGEGWNQTLGNCTVCPAGTYHASGQSIFCEPCDPGWISAGGVAACTMCTESLGGTKSDVLRTFCSDCTAGQYIFEDTVCIDCPAGTFAPGAVEDECVDCQAGFYAQLNVVEEPADVFNLRYTACEACGAGTFSEQNSVNCTLCAPGASTSGQPGRGECDDCAAGKFAAGRGTRACVDCAVGLFQSATGATNCTECAPGKANRYEGQPLCEACDQGKYASSTGKLTCKECDAGTFAAAEGSATCEDCPAGRYVSSAGQVSCEVCIAGYFQDAEGQSQCKPCSQGYYSDSDNATQCNICPAGKRSDPASPECDICEAGKFSQKAGQSICEYCPYPHYSSAGADFCDACEVGYMFDPFSGRQHENRSYADEYCLQCNVELADCEVFSTLNNFSLLPGHFRFTINSTDIYPCPNLNCKGGEVVGDSSCASGSGGALCDECDNGYYRSADACLPCSEAAGWVETTVIVGTASVVLVLAMLVLAKFYGERMTQWYEANETRILEFEQKLTAIFVTMQIILLMSESHASLGGSTMPDPYASFLDKLSFMSMDFLSIMPTDCIKQTGHWEYMLFSTLVPLVAFLLVALVCLVLRDDKKTFVIRGYFTSFILLMLPIISRRVCHTFRCDWYDAGNPLVEPVELLRVDLTVDCTTEEYWQMFNYALLMVAIYPFGVPIVLLIWLSRLRAHLHPRGVSEARALEMRENDSVLAESAISYLGRIHRPKYWYYEIVVNTGRRLILTCAVLACQTLSQVICFMVVVATVTTVIERETQPHINPLLGAFVYVLQWQVLLCIQAMLLLDSKLITDGDNGYVVVGVFLLVSNALLMAVVFLDTYQDLEREKVEQAARNEWDTYVAEVGEDDDTIHWMGNTVMPTNLMKHHQSTHGVEHIGMTVQVNPAHASGPMTPPRGLPTDQLRGGELEMEDLSSWNIQTTSLDGGGLQPRQPPSAPFEASPDNRLLSVGLAHAAATGHQSGMRSTRTFKAKSRRSLAHARFLREESRAQGSGGATNSATSAACAAATSAATNVMRSKPSTQRETRRRLRERQKARKAAAMQRMNAQLEKVETENVAPYTSIGGETQHQSPSRDSAMDRLDEDAGEARWSIAEPSTQPRAPAWMKQNAERDSDVRWSTADYDNEQQSNFRQTHVNAFADAHMGIPPRAETGGIGVGSRWNSAWRECQVEVIDKEGEQHAHPEATTSAREHGYGDELAEYGANDDQTNVHGGKPVDNSAGDDFLFNQDYAEEWGQQAEHQHAYDTEYQQESVGVVDATTSDGEDETGYEEMDFYEQMRIAIEMEEQQEYGDL